VTQLSRRLKREHENWFTEFPVSEKIAIIRESRLKPRHLEAAGIAWVLYSDSSSDGECE
jgi:hypothetical protein